MLVQKATIYYNTIKQSNYILYEVNAEQMAKFFHGELGNKYKCKLMTEIPVYDDNLVKKCIEACKATPGKSGLSLPQKSPAKSRQQSPPPPSGQLALTDGSLNAQEQACLQSTCYCTVSLCVCVCECERVCSHRQHVLVSWLSTFFTFVFERSLNG